MARRLVIEYASHVAESDEAIDGLKPLESEART